MKDNETKNKFIELRTKGLSYDKIAEQIKVNKKTLMKWNFEFNETIQDLKFEAVDSLLNDFMITKEKRVEYLIKTLNKLHTEVESRTDFKKVSLLNLIKIENELTDKLRFELKDYEHSTDKILTVKGGIDFVDNLTDHTEKLTSKLDY